MSGSRKILNILVHGMKRAKRGSVQRSIFRVAIFSEVSSAETNQLERDVDEKLLLDWVDGDDKETR